MKTRQFYTELGKLLYAVADVDGIISKNEKESLLQEIRTRLVHRENHTDRFGTNEAWYTAFSFEAAEDQGLTTEEAFSSFADFVHENRNELATVEKELCLVLANRLAEAYHHTSRKEKVLIEKLRHLLEESTIN